MNKNLKIEVRHGEYLVVLQGKTEIAQIFTRGEADTLPSSGNKGTERKKDELAAVYSGKNRHLLLSEFGEPDSYCVVFPSKDAALEAINKTAGLLVVPTGDPRPEPVEEGGVTWRPVTKI